MARNNSSIYTDDELSKHVVQLCLQKPTDKLVQLLSENPGCVNSVYQDYTPLIAAARKGQLETLSLLLSNGAEVKGVNRKNQCALLFACRLNHLSIVKLLLDHKADVNCCNPQDELTALLTAVKNSHFKIVNILLDHEADVTYTTKKGINVLMIAARHASAEVMQLLLKHCPKSILNEKDCNGCTALSHAIYHNQKDNMLLLLNSKVDVNIENNIGQTALMLALGLSKLDMADLLLRNGADLNHTDYEGNSILMLASSQNKYDVVEWYMKQASNLYKPCLGEINTPIPFNKEISDLDITESTCSDYKALIPVAKKEASTFSSPNKVTCACDYEDNVTEQNRQPCAGNNKNVFREITTTPTFSNNNNNNTYGTVSDLESKIQLVNKTGFNALHFASKNAFTSIVQLLLNNGANANSENAFGWTPLMLASCCTESIPCLTLFIDKGGVDVNFTNTDGWSALKVATYFGHLNTVEFLYSNGAKIKCPGDNSFNILKLASATGHYDIVKFIVTHEADVNEVNDDGITSLMAATLACNKSAKIIKLLIDSGANVNIVDKCGRSALTHACCYGNSEAVGVLCANGADILVIDKWGLNCVMNACKYGHLNVLKELTEIQKCDLNAVYPVHFSSVTFNGNLENFSFPQEHSIDQPVIIESVSACTIAALCGHRKCVNYLLSSQVCLSEDMKYIAIDIASRRGYHEIVSALQGYMLTSSPSLKVESLTKPFVGAYCPSSPKDSVAEDSFSPNVGEPINSGAIYTNSAYQHCNNHLGNFPSFNVDTSANAVVETSANAVVETSANAVVETSANAVVETSANPVVETSANPVVEKTANAVVETSANEVVETSANAVVEADSSPSKMMGLTDLDLETDSSIMNVRGLANSYAEKDSADFHDSSQSKDSINTIQTLQANMDIHLFGHMLTVLPKNSIINLHVHFESNTKIENLHSLSFQSSNIDRSNILDSNISPAYNSMSVNVKNAQFMAFDNSVINTSPHQ
ncbi:ankyrin repeat protein [Biomphalaria pfeifferi]|uniref:Ankyrin repeat protein n=1 Tax=Biomphalaria pfeifferi TaxID=112525 RepID=A0AAD8F0T7_BIOPF|nr:ankyrin repeat protein [Biomphalaria pfeifferi]